MIFAYICLNVYEKVFLFFEFIKGYGVYMKQLDKTKDHTTQVKADWTPFPTPSIEELDKSEVTARLIELIRDMSEAVQRNLLKELQNKHTGEKRTYSRKTSLIAIDCSTHDVCLTNFIQDISSGGVFIETNAPLYVGQELKMNFSLPEVENPISIGGEVVRVDSHGIGVKFISGDVHKLDINNVA
jgi:Tfp pilus assembly protein PilZ